MLDSMIDPDEYEEWDGGLTDEEIQELKEDAEIAKMEAKYNL